ncbi:MAG TPA: hypothetical protein VJR89_06550 [Polyangiales bacterium]|nr:hypothetical protein [Polyangiales bacterium]
MPDARADATAEAEPRRATRLFILGFLAFQIAMPLRYYLGERGYDERFSWRMFSTLRLQDCAISVAEATSRGPNGALEYRDVKVPRDVQAAWVNLLERVRRPVVEKYLARRCERQALSVKYTRRCTNTDGSALPARTLELDCSDGSLREAAP